MRRPVVLQPKELFEILNVKNTGDAESLLNLVFAMLVYLKPGDEITTSYVALEKLSDDLVYLRVNPDNIHPLDTLDRKRVVRMPV